MKALKTISLAALALITAAAIATPSQADDNFGGVVIGGALGGLLGSTVGKGRGRLVATATGALVGSMIGNHLQSKPAYAARPAPEPVYHSRHNRNDRRYRRPVARDHRRANPPRVVYVRPVAPPVTETVQVTTRYDPSSGQYCREYQREVIINGQPVSAFGRACQQPDGSWKIVDAERNAY